MTNVVSYDYHQHGDEQMLADCLPGLFPLISGDVVAEDRKHGQPPGYANHDGRRKREQEDRDDEGQSKPELG